MNFDATKCDESSISLLSLFSGCGGMDLGFEGDFEVLRPSVNPSIHPDWKIGPGINDHWAHLEKTRFRTIFANDIRPDAKRAWTSYFSDKGIDKSIYYLDSIVDLVKKHRNGDTTIFPKGIEVVTGGFPCQDFSLAGKRMGLRSNKSHTGEKIEDDRPSVENRGQLYMWMREVIAITQPKIFIAENVKGLLTNFADAKNTIETDFRSVSENGYLVVNAKVLHAADYGVPQSRQRIVFIGMKKSALTKDALKALSGDAIPEAYDPYPPATHSFTKRGDNLLPPTTLSQAFLGLDEPERSKDPSHQKYSRAKYMGKGLQGQSEIDIEGIGPTIRSEHHGNIEYRRLSKEHGGKINSELNGGLKERRLTVRECARIQTFPDKYNFIIPPNNNEKSVSASDAYKLIGNAVPPLLGYHIAKRIDKNWNLYFGER
jgi:DNA (cytosine-5)-methyltransferase 1